MHVHLLSIVLAVLAGTIMGTASTSEAKARPAARGPGENMMPFNTTMPDGTVKVVWLHDGFQPVRPLDPGYQLSRRLAWHPGTEDDECGPSTFEDITSTGSAHVGDCQVVINQMLASPGYWYAYQSVDFPANDDWCRIAFHETVSIYSVSYLLISPHPACLCSEELTWRRTAVRLRHPHTGLGRHQDGNNRHRRPHERGY